MLTQHNNIYDLRNDYNANNNNKKNDFQKSMENADEMLKKEPKKII